MAPGCRPTATTPAVRSSAPYSCRVKNEQKQAGKGQRWKRARSWLQATDA